VYSLNMRDQLLNMSHLSRKGTLVWSLPTKVNKSIVVLLRCHFYGNEVRNTTVQAMKKRQLRCKLWKEGKLVYSLKMRDQLLQTSHLSREGTTVWRQADIRQWQAYEACTTV